MTLREAAQQGIQYVKRPLWANPEDRLKLTILEFGGEKRLGPWAKFYSERVQKEVLGIESPQTVLAINDELTDWEPWTGTLPPGEVIS